MAGKRLRILVVLILGLCSMYEPVEIWSEPQKKTTDTRRRKTKNTGNKSTNNKTSTKGNNKNTQKKQNPTTSAEAKKRQVEAQKEIKLTEEQIRENEVKVSRGLNELGKLDVEISATSNKIKELGGQVNRLDGEIKGLEAGISSNEKELSKLRDEYLKAVKKMRVTKKNKSTLAFVFSSKNLSQALRRMRYLREFSEWRGRQTEEINGKIADLKQQKESLAKAKDERQNALALQKSNQTKLASQHKQQEEIVAQLKQNGAALESHLKRKQAEASELGNMVSQLIAEEQRKAAEEARRKAEEEARQKAEEERLRQEAEKQRQEEEAQLLAQQNNNRKGSSNTKENTKNKEKENKKKEKKENKKEEKKQAPTEYADARKRKPRSSSEGTVSTSGGNIEKTSSGNSFSDMRGRLPYPTTGSFSVTSRFGRQNLPDLPGVEYDNPGIDAETEAGAAAKAVYKGKVSGVYLLPGYNTVVIVNHGNYYTVYGNIASPSVKTGDTVESGTNLGALALSDEDNRHASIHFEVWKNREKLNPQEWLK